MKQYETKDNKNNCLVDTIQKNEKCVIDLSNIGCCYIDTQIFEYLKQHNFVLKGSFICDKNEFLKSSFIKNNSVAITLNQSLAIKLSRCGYHVCFVNKHCNDYCDFITDFETGIEGLPRKLSRISDLSHDDNELSDIKRGSIVMYMNNLYYVYGEEGNNWLVFLINENYSVEEENNNVLEIGFRKFSTTYIVDEITKNSFGIEKLCQATDDEIDMIHAQKKDYKKRNQKLEKQKKHLSCKNIGEKSIFTFYNNARVLTQYIVLVRVGNGAYCCEVCDDNKKTKLEFITLNKYCRKVGVIDDDKYFSLLNLYSGSLELYCKNFKHKYKELTLSIGDKK